MNRRLADHLAITYTYLQKYRWGDHDTLPLDAPPDPPDEDFAAFLEGMKLNARRARASA